MPNGLIDEEAPPQSCKIVAPMQQFHSNLSVELGHCRVFPAVRRFLRNHSKDEPPSTVVRGNRELCEQYCAGAGLFDRHRFGEVARLIHIGAHDDGSVVGDELDGYRVEDR
jgi:hypothetical protein